MFLLRFFSVRRAYRDLRRFMLTRKPYELWFLALAMAITLLILAGFAKDSNIEVPYHENIIYMQSWPSDRTEAQILAQQKVDALAKAKADAILDQQRRARQAQFKQLDDKLTSWGI
ncbi:hypothetical protein EAH87_13450 [Sphingomonas koreensis]|nr:hypothetical protein EAH87_13450 [Sphingomonas koreensis]